MCGISGIFDWKKLKEADVIVEKMLDSQHKRGPDYRSIYSDEEVFLAHNRLSIIDLAEKANQPMKSNDGDVVISYNGELYNYLNLKEELKANYHFKTNSDTEVIIAAYQKWGMDMLKFFDGMFAFAIWDKSSKNFFLCRDRLGIKPLYYLELGKSIVFSSSTKAILNAFPNQKFSLDKNAVIDFMNYGTAYNPSTIFNEIKSLEKGKYIKLNNETYEKIQYWLPQLNNSSKIASYYHVKKEVNRLILEAVEKRLIADVPVGIFLSGGIDSSAIVAAASKVKKNEINTFSVVFDDESYDESTYANIIAKHYSTKHKEIKVNSDFILHNIYDFIRSMDHPTVDGFNSYIISDAVSKENFKVALSGTGSDELFLGYPFYTLAKRFEESKWIQSFPPIIKKAVGSSLKKVYPGLKGDKIASILNQKFISLDYFYPYFRKSFSAKEIHQLCPTYSNNSTSFSYKWFHQYIGADSVWPFYSNLSMLEMECYLQHVLLRDADQMGMSHSLEIRVPFLDHNLVEFVLALPDKFKTGRFQKQLLIDAIDGWIPTNIVDRKKMGFVLPIEKWMKNELQSFCEQSLLDLERFPELNMRFIKQFWDSFLAGKPNAHWIKIWTLVIFSQWTAVNNLHQIND